MITRCICLGLISLVSTMMSAAPAAAQTALGSGNALDNNLGVGTGGINQPAAAPNYRERNLIVTGDVIGGRGFRGSVGYTAEADFRGALGSNDLFRFRADSAISSPQLFQLGYTYEQLRYGQAVGMVEYRRAGSADPASVMANDPIVISDSTAMRRMDRQTLANSLTFTQAQTVEPRVIGSRYAEDGSLLYFNASTVRGIIVEPADRAASLLGLSTFDTARLIEDAIAGERNVRVGAEYVTQFEAIGVNAPEPPAPSQPTGELAGGQRVETSVSAQHDAILERVVERYAGASGTPQPTSTEVIRNLDQNYQQLRDQLSGRTQADDQGQFQATRPGWQQQTQPGSSEQAPSTTQRDQATAPTPVRGLEHLSPAPPTAEQPRATTDRPPGTDVAPLPRDDNRRAPLVKPELTGALKHGIRVDQLSTAMQGRFNELLESAEKSLSEGDYFLAERRFERALRLVPGHPMATVGMAHAQLGAGLYLSASLTLRTLMEAQPEMIDVTYAPHLLPTTERLNAAVEAVRTRMAEAQPRDQANYGFLLAYIGHQSQDDALLREGLNTMRQADAQNALLPVLEQIWLSAEIPTPATSAPDAPPPTPQK
jgi:hypothetical protein